MIKGIADGLRSLKEEIKEYWGLYGGYRYVLTSPFFVLAVLVTFACFPLWWIGSWWDRTISIIPSILGFSIAAFALLLAIGDDGFKLKLGQSLAADKPSTLTNTATSFFHFIIVQVLALAFGMVASARPISFLIGHASWFDHSAWYGMLLWFLAKVFRVVGFLLLTYSIMTALATALSIFRLAKIFSVYAGSKPKDGGQKK